MKNRVIIFLILFFSFFLIFFSGENLKSGNFHGEIVVDGISRVFYFHIPKSALKKDRIPLVILLHGGFGTPESIRKHTHFDEISDKNGFIVIYPKGFRKHWNDGRRVKGFYTKSNLDDVKFISRLIDFFIENYNVDKKRVYVAGISNGGFMSFRLSCEIPQKIAAIAIVSGSMSPWLMSHSKSNLPVSVLIINGTEDPLVKWNGGEIKFLGFSRGMSLPVRKVLKYWINRDKCDKKFKRRWLKDKNPYDGTIVFVERYVNTRDGYEVVLYGIKGGGHAWPGDRRRLTKRFAGRVSNEIDASKVIWDFFKKHQR